MNNLEKVIEAQNTIEKLQGLNVIQQEIKESIEKLLKVLNLELGNN